MPHTKLLFELEDEIGNCCAIKASDEEVINIYIRIYVVIEVYLWMSKDGSTLLN